MVVVIKIDGYHLQCNLPILSFSHIATSSLMIPGFIASPENSHKLATFHFVNHFRISSTQQGKKILCSLVIYTLHLMFQVYFGKLWLGISLSFVISYVHSTLHGQHLYKLNTLFLIANESRELRI